MTGRKSAARAITRRANGVLCSEDQTVTKSRNSGSASLSRSSPPRVDLAIEVETNGKPEKIRLPFVMGVLAPLSGKSNVPRQPVHRRKFIEFDAHSLDDRIREMRPRAHFTVANLITGRDQLEIDLEFECLTDFSPGALARRVPVLRALLEEREKLSALKTNMGGKPEAERAVLDVLAGRLTPSPKENSDD